jgi:hypothetical protein
MFITKEPGKTVSLKTGANCSTNKQHGYIFEIPNADEALGIFISISQGLGIVKLILLAFSISLSPQILPLRFSANSLQN